MSSVRPDSADVIIIGGGHNGLVCAATLARAGQSVLVLEAAEHVGGMAITRRFAEGFKVSAAAHLFNQMPLSLVRDLNLKHHGLAFAATDLPTIGLSPDEAPLRMGDLDALNVRSEADARAYAPFDRRMNRFGKLIHAILASTPPRLGTTLWEDKWALAKMALKLRLLGRKEMRELLRIIGMNAYDLFEDEFQTPVLKGVLGFDAIVGSNFGPRAPGTVLTYLYRRAAEVSADSSTFVQPIGGLGTVTQALARAAEAAGARIRTQAPVARILVENDHASGVLLESGETIVANTVISNVDAKTTFLNLLGTEHLDTGFVRRIDHFRSAGMTAKLHLALAKRPNFTGVKPEWLGGRLVLSASLNELERAFNPTKYQSVSATPALEITIPTIHDSSLAPTGQHVLSSVVQYVPYSIKGGWQTHRAALTTQLIDLLDQHAPGLRDSVVAAELLTPEDLEKEFRVTGGHWHHGDLAFDQFYMVRPVPGATQYQTPLPGLYLCGASSHPGGGVMGLAGRHAAHRVMSKSP